MRVLIIVPAYNEEESLPSVLRGLLSLPEGYEVLIINDGSTDGTMEVAAQAASILPMPVHVVSLAFNAGIGVAVQTGYRFAENDGGFEYVVQFDGDGQHAPSSIVPLVSKCRESGADLCLGSRFLVASSGGDRSTPSRRFGSRILRAMIWFTTGQRLTDPTSGLRCAGTKAWKSFAKLYPDDFPEPESLVWCLRNRLRVVEFPVEMRSRVGGQSSISAFKGVYYMVKVIVSIGFDRFRSREV